MNFPNRRQPPPEEQKVSPNQGKQQCYKRNSQEIGDSFWKSELFDESNDDLLYYLDKLDIQQDAPTYLKAQPSQEQVLEKRSQKERSETDLDEFKDQSFGHNNESVLGKYPDGKTLEELRDSIWKSIKSTHKLVVDRVEYKDVQQRILGDCYFLAVVCALIKIKGKVLELFSIKKMSHGAYEVTCYYMGQKETLILDSYFPFKNSSTFTGTNGKESWVLLLEKAFAKKFKSYAAIEGGFSPDAMRFLTGAPAQTFYTSNLSKSLKKWIWYLLALPNSEYLFTCSIGQESEEHKEMKLAGDHVYTILYAFETKSGEKLLLIRNPWGSRNGKRIGEWEGKWSDKYLQEHIDMLKQFPYKYKGEDDGVFHISYDDFLQYFESVEVCFFHRNFVLRSSKKVISNPNEVKTFSIAVDEEETSFFIMVNQESERKFSPFSGYFGFEYSEICFNVLDSKGSWIFEEPITGNVEQPWTKVTLPRGKYSVAIKIKWSRFALENKINHFVLNTYGPKNVYLR